MAAERALLFALNFDFKVDIPDAWVLPAVRALGVPVPRHGQAAAGPGEAAAQDVVTKTYCLLTSRWALFFGGDFVCVGLGLGTLAARRAQDV